jgi:diacylglycerol kinase family enzyme
MRRSDWLFAALASRGVDEPRFEVALDGAPPVLARYVAIFNCGRYAGGFHACPAARCDDGLFHVLTLREPVAPRLFRVAWAFGRGTAARLPDAALATGRTIALRGARRSQVDGDPGPDGDLAVSIEPGALRVLAPARRA